MKQKETTIKHCKSVATFFSPKQYEPFASLKGGEQACSTAFRAVDGSLCHCFFEVEGSTAVREEKVTTVHQRGDKKKTKTL